MKLINDAETNNFKKIYKTLIIIQKQSIDMEFYNNISFPKSDNKLK